MGFKFDPLTAQMVITPQKNRVLSGWPDVAHLGGGGAPPAPLDAWTGNAPVFGISTRALSKAKAGTAAGTLINGAASTQTFNFLGSGELDQAAIATFLSGKGGWSAVVDQVNGLTVSQSTTDNTPSWRVNALGRPTLSLYNSINFAGLGTGPRAFSVASGPTVSAANGSTIYMVLQSLGTYTGTASEQDGLPGLSFGTQFGMFSGTRTSGVSGPIWNTWLNGSAPSMLNIAPSNLGFSVVALRYTGTTIEVTCDGYTYSISGTALSGALSTIGWLLNSGSFATDGSDILAFILAQGHSASDVAANCAALRTWVGLKYPTDLLVFVGDSITAGYQASITTDVWELSWPWAGVGGQPAFSKVRALNYARQSFQIADLSADVSFGFASLITARPSVADFTNKIVVVMAGTNDINAGGTGAQAITDLTALVASYKSAGATKVGVCTQIPRQGFTTLQNTQLAILNAGILSGIGDLQIDMASLNWVPGGDWTVNYQGDGTHPNTSGVAMMSAFAKPIITPLL